MDVEEEEGAEAEEEEEEEEAAEARRGVPHPPLELSSWLVLLVLVGLLLHRGCGGVPW